MKLTGERPMEGATPDSLIALHDAGYREVGGLVWARASWWTSAAESVRRPSGSRRRIAWWSASTTAARRCNTTVDRTLPRQPAASRRRLRSQRREARGAQRQCRLRGLVAHHRALRKSRAPRDRARPGPPHDGTAFVLTPNAPPTSKTRSTCIRSSPSTSCRCSRCSSTTCVATASTATKCQGRFRRARASGERLLRLDVLKSVHDPPPRVRVGLRTHPPAHLPLPRSVEHRHRLGHRRVALLSPRRREARHARALRRRAPAAVPGSNDAGANHQGLGHRSHAQRGREHRHARAADPRRGGRRAHPGRRRRQHRRHRGEGRSARSRARRHRGAPPAPQDGARQRLPRRAHDRHRPRLRRHDPDRRRPVARSGRAPRPARRDRARRRSRDRLPVRSRRLGAQLAQAPPAALGVGQSLRRLRVADPCCATRPRDTARTARRSCGRWTSSRRTPRDTPSRSR